MTRDAPKHAASVSLSARLLFPHLQRGENIDYGAPVAASSRAELVQRLASPTSAIATCILSGGERQLVALARALARRPALVLLDEPFSALDPKRRSLARREVRALHREWGFTALQVTHDFTEAGLLGDVAILLDAGRVLQYGPPEEVFRRPATPYVAEFLGAENVLAGSVQVLRDAPPDFVVGDASPAMEGGVHALEFVSGPITIYTVGSATQGGLRRDPSERSRWRAARSIHVGAHVFRGRLLELSTLGALAASHGRERRAARRGTHLPLGAGTRLARRGGGLGIVQGHAYIC